MAKRQSGGGFSLSWIGMLIPVGYCFGMVYYFNSVDAQYGFLSLGQNRDFVSTKFGLTVVGLLFCVPLLFKLVRFMAGQASTAAPRKPGASRWDDDETASDPDFDPDAMIARYLANRSHQPESAEAKAAEPEAPAQPARPAFGRRKV